MISVCLAAYNGGSYIEKQIESILCQIGLEDELIITDDASSDDTVKIIKSFSDRRIKLIENDDTLGYSMNFSKAICLAQGEYIFLSDQDDVWHIDKVSLCLEELQSNDVVAHDAVIFYSDPEKNFGYFSQFVRPDVSFLSNLYRIRFLGCCLALRRSVAEELFPLRGKRYITHDGIICVVGTFLYKFKYISRPLIYYRRHEHNTSLGHQKSSNTILVKSHIRINYILALFRIITRRFMR